MNEHLSESMRASVMDNAVGHKSEMKARMDIIEAATGPRSMHAFKEKYNISNQDFSVILAEAIERVRADLSYSCDLYAAVQLHEHSAHAKKTYRISLAPTLIQVANEIKAAFEMIADNAPKPTIPYVKPVQKKNRAERRREEKKHA